MRADHDILYFLISWYKLENGHCPTKARFHGEKKNIEWLCDELNPVVSFKLYSVY